MISYITVIIAIILTGISQILLKKGAFSAKKGFFGMFLNLFTLSGYLLLFTVTILNLYSFMFLDLKFNVIVVPASIILVTILSVVFLKERLTKCQIVGGIIVIFGVIIFNL